MGKKKLKVSKMKMKALYIEKCKEMVKKRKQSFEQKKAMESSLDIIKIERITLDSLEGIQEMSSSYAELQNVTLTTAENDQNPLQSHFERNIKIENQYNETDRASNLLQENQYEENNAFEYIVEDTSKATMQTDIKNLGHRIVDVNHFTSELIKMSQHKSLFQCGLSTMKLVSEHQRGLQSDFTYVCMICSYRNKMKLSLDDVNKDAVAGIMAAGYDHTQLNQFSAAVGLPIMSEYTYNKTQDELNRDLEGTAWDEMKLAGEREREEAIDEGGASEDYRMTEVSEVKIEQPDSPQQSEPKSDEDEPTENRTTSFPMHKPRSSQPPKEMREELLKIEQKKLQILEAEVAKSTVFMKSDNYQFLMSLLPEMEKLPSLQKMRLRMKISQAVLDEMTLYEQEKFNNIEISQIQDGGLNTMSVEVKEEPINMYD